MNLMRRRSFIAFLGGAGAWPLTTHGQADRARKIGWLIGLAETDSEGKARVAAFRETIQKFGWTDGRNLRLETRFAPDAERQRVAAAELVGLAPDVLLASATSSLSALQRATKTIPIVFAGVTDPVTNGFVASLGRPGGNITGFALPEQAIGGKRLELLKEIAPHVTRVALVHDPANATWVGYLAELGAVSASFGVKISPVPLRSAAEIEHTIGDFASEPNGGLIVVAGPVITSNRELISMLAVRNRLPDVYPFRYFVVAGGLASYGVDNLDTHRRAAGYVDRILKGESPAELPVQQAAKFELVVNLKTAKALALEPSFQVLARADEVIE